MKVPRGSVSGERGRNAGRKPGNGFSSDDRPRMRKRARPGVGGRTGQGGRLALIAKWQARIVDPVRVGRETGNPYRLEKGYHERIGFGQSGATGEPDGSEAQPANPGAGSQRAIARQGCYATLTLSMHSGWANWNVGHLEPLSFLKRSFSD